MTASNTQTTSSTMKKTPQEEAKQIIANLKKIQKVKSIKQPSELELFSRNKDVRATARELLKEYAKDKKMPMKDVLKHFNDIFERRNLLPTNAKGEMKRIGAKTFNEKIAPKKRNSNQEKIN